MALQKNDATSYEPSSHRTLLVYGPSGGSVHRCSFLDASVLFRVSMLVCAVVTLWPRVGVSNDEFLCVLSDATSSRGPFIGVEVSDRLSLASSFSPQVQSSRIIECLILRWTSMSYGRFKVGGCGGL